MEVFLIITGLLLVVINTMAIKKDKKSFKGVIKDTEDNMDDFKIEIGKARREFSETILELQKEILELKEQLYKSNIQSNSQEDSSENLIKSTLLIEEEKKIDYNDNSESIKHKMNNSNVNEEKNVTELTNNISQDNSVKINEIKSLINKGYSLNEIADKLKIGKGEVLLIKDLYIK